MKQPLKRALFSIASIAGALAASGVQAQALTPIDQLPAALRTRVATEISEQLAQNPDLLQNSNTITVIDEEGTVYEIPIGSFDISESGNPSGFGRGD